MFGRQKIAALAAEFVGTAILATAVLSISRWTDFPYFAAVVAGLVVALTALVLGPVSGAHINPLVTLGLWTMRKIQTTQAVVYIGAQMLGGLAAWQLGEYLLNRPLRNIAGGGLDWRVLAAEAIGSFVFAMAVYAAVVNNYDWPKLALASGAGLTLGIILASLASNGIVNPAVAVGVQSWNWSYTLGPVAGAVVGMNVYGYLFSPSTPKKRRALTAILTKGTVAKRRGAKAQKAKK